MFSAWPGPLHAVANHGNGVVFQHGQRFFQGEFLAGNYVFVDAAKIDLCHK
jgi:hypothetical protein